MKLVYNVFYLRKAAWESIQWQTAKAWIAPVLLSEARLSIVLSIDTVNTIGRRLSPGFPTEGLSSTSHTLAQTFQDRHRLFPGYTSI